MFGDRRRRPRILREIVGLERSVEDDDDAVASAPDPHRERLGIDPRRCDGGVAFWIAAAAGDPAGSG
jgi:hypothetical protein